MGKKKMKNYKFWMKSSRGTDVSKVFSLPEDISDAEMRNKLEDWCSQYGCWESSENHMSYGWKEVEEVKEEDKKFADSMKKQMVSGFILAFNGCVEEVGIELAMKAGREALGEVRCKMAKIENKKR